MYNYQTERPRLFTEDGQKMFLQIRDDVKAILAKSGAVTMGKAIDVATGSNWVMMACVDRLVELGEIVEVPNTIYGYAQHRIFILKQ